MGRKIIGMGISFGAQEANELGSNTGVAYKFWMATNLISLRCYLTASLELIKLSPRG